MQKLQTLLLVSLMLAMACQPTKSKMERASTTSENANLDTKKSLYRFPIKKAKQDIKRYDSISQLVFAKGYENKIPIKAFTIRAIDLLEVLGLPDTTTTEYDHVRVYIGVNNKYDFKLFLNPVDSANLSANPPRAGVDVILTGEIDGQLGDDEGYVLDFSAPCPTTCPDDIE